MVGVNHLTVGMKSLQSYVLEKLSYRLDKCFCRPYHIHFDVADRCCLRCRHCDVWRKSGGKELTTAECKNIIVNLKSWLGSFALTFSGGEPFMREDLIELIAYASQNNVITHVQTTGVLIDKKTAEEVTSSGLDKITVSLDGFRPETHDYIRGVEGTHSRVTSGIRYLRDLNAGQRIYIQTVLMKCNLGEVIDLVGWVESNDVDGVIFQNFWPDIHFFPEFCAMRTSDREYDPIWHGKSEFWPDYGEVCVVLDRLIKLKRGGARIVNSVGQLKLMKTYFKNPMAGTDYACFAGLRNFRIDAQGNVRLCYGMGKIGSLVSSSPRDIWYSREAERRRREIKSCNMNCNILNGCNLNVGVWDNVKKLTMFFPRA
jgi:MoaA/NifB/PqqE/SkfB family radical SAM enzyme